jgi:hypothetical protein
MRKFVVLVVLLTGCCGTKTAVYKFQPPIVEMPSKPTDGVLRILPSVGGQTEPVQYVIPIHELPKQQKATEPTKDESYWKPLAITLLGIWAAGSAAGYAKIKVKDSLTT